MTSSEEDPTKAERRRLAAAFDDVLAEPVPERLRALVAPPASTVVDLAAERARRRAVPAWGAWGGMAATLLLGTLLGALFTRPAELGSDAAHPVATGAIATALTRQLASDAAGPVAVQLSFKDRTGRYCRSFTTPAVAGLACREAGGAWALQQLLAAPAPTPGALRQATTSLPPALMSAIDATAAGPTLNAAEERAARDAGWAR